MQEVTIDPDMLGKAHKQAKELGVVYRSVTQGFGNVAGFVGEHMAQKLYGGKLENTFKYDLILPDGRRMDVKTKRVKFKPIDSYECSISAYQIDYDCDGYIFVRVMHSLKSGWVLGDISKRDFKIKSVLHKTGERDPDNGFVFRSACYNVPIGELNPI